MRLLDWELFPDWELRLERELRAWRRRSFEWGVSDCVHFTAACIKAMTGENHVKDIAVYSSEREALMILAARDHRGLQAATEVVLGPCVDIAPNHVPVDKGDVVLAMRPVADRPGDTGPGLGICLGSTAIFIGRDGLETIPVRECICGWNIG